MKNLLNKEEREAINKLIEFHGGAQSIEKEIKLAGEKQNRLEKLKQLENKKWYSLVCKAEELAAQSGITGKDVGETDERLGKGTTQVSGFQGADALFSFLQNLVKNSAEDNCIIPSELISVVGLSDEYVYGGDLLATLTIAENTLGVNRFCTSSLVGTPQQEVRFIALEKITGLSFLRTKIDGKYSAVNLVNQGTPFGNLCGIECSNDNHILYLDGIIRAAKETGATFFLNPSWNTIVAGCYLGTLIPSIKFKVSCFLASQSTLHFNLLTEIINQFLLPNGTSPIVEINIGNGASADTFSRCSKLLKDIGLEKIDLAAHIRINNDLGREDYNWFKNAKDVIEKGHNITLKYECAGVDSSLDTISAYFVSDEERVRNAKDLGKILYQRCCMATRDALELQSAGAQIKVAGGIL